jgi:hypothetical protein
MSGAICSVSCANPKISHTSTHIFFFLFSLFDRRNIPKLPPAELDRIGTFGPFKELASQQAMAQQKKAKNHPAKAGAAFRSTNALKTKMAHRIYIHRH